MNNVKTVINENNEQVTVEILLGFEIEEFGKRYIAYTLNDDGVSESVNVFISEIVSDGEQLKVGSIKEEEKETVLIFYEAAKETMGIE